MEAQLQHNRYVLSSHQPAHKDAFCISCTVDNFKLHVMMPYIALLHSAMLSC